MVQGDKYEQKIQIKKGGTIITSSNCDGVKIKLGHTVYSSEDSEVTYDSVEQKWVFLISQEESLTLCENTPYQVQVKIGTSIYTSPIKFVTVYRGIITETWS